MWLGFRHLTIDSLSPPWIILSWTLKCAFVQMHALPTTKCVWARELSEGNGAKTGKINDKFYCQIQPSFKRQCFRRNWLFSLSWECFQSFKWFYSGVKDQPVSKIAFREAVLLRSKEEWKFSSRDVEINVLFTSILEFQERFLKLFIDHERSLSMEIWTLGELKDRYFHNRKKNIVIKKQVKPIKTAWYLIH